jgi:hypothetical protein
MLHHKAFHIDTKRYPYGELHSAALHVRGRGVFVGQGRSRAQAIERAVLRWRMIRSGACEGHTSTSGAIGNTVYCNGSCRTVR